MPRQAHCVAFEYTTEVCRDASVEVVTTKGHEPGRGSPPDAASLEMVLAAFVVRTPAYPSHGRISAAEPARA